MPVPGVVTCALSARQLAMYLFYDAKAKTGNGEDPRVDINGFKFTFPEGQWPLAEILQELNYSKR